MGGARPRGPNQSPVSLNLPAAPAFYPTEEEFRDPLGYIDQIRPLAEPFGICRIVPPASWNPPFAINLASFAFPTKSQAIHHLQARPAPCDPATFELEYRRFLEKHGNKRRRTRPVFRGEDLDLCRLYNAVKRYGGYDRVVGEKKWADVFRIVFLSAKVSPCSTHVLSQSYREHLLDYERYRSFLSRGSKQVRKWRRGGRRIRKEKVAHGSEGTKKRKRPPEGEDDREAIVEESDGQGNAGKICEQCGSGLHGDVMLLCDRCDCGWHLYCLSPPLERVPAGNWYCLECLNSDKDSFGFVPGKKYTLDTFKRLAKRVKRKWLGTASATHTQIEKRFWEILEGLAGEVQVMYGNDLDTSLYGSGFPRAGDSVLPSVEQEVWKAYSDSPWNLNNLPKLKGSMLRAVHGNITGVTVPWLYVGMLFSSFCWHVEDHCFYSMNYLHWGEPKCWYSVPGSEAHAFEKVMRKILPDLFEAQPDLLFQLVTMLNPSVLRENGVNVYRLIQEPGNFVITFPRAFHAGFNCGLNCAEAVNFAPADWLPHGGFGADLYRLYHKTAVLSHEELVCVARKNNWSEKAASYLKQEMRRIFVKEKTYREALWKKGLVKSSPMHVRNQPEFVGTEEDPLCMICRQYLFISAVVCDCRPTSFVCLEHCEQLCECTPDEHRLLYRYTLAELDDFLLMRRLESGTCYLDAKPHQQNELLNESFGHVDNSKGLMKKVKGQNAYFSQLANDWLSVALGICKSPYSESAFERILLEAEQFLWAGHEINPVRDMAKNLLDARKWSQSLRACLSKVESFLLLDDCSAAKVPLKNVEDLLGFYPLPCNEPGYPKLKEYAEDARTLSHEMKAALTSGSHSTITELETLWAKVLESPIELEESNVIGKQISLVKVWLDNVRRCLSEVGKPSTVVEVDALYSLEAEMLELHVHLPEMEQLKGLMAQVETCHSRCCEILKGPIKMKDLNDLLQDTISFVVSTPELKLLKQYHSNAIAWISHCHDTLANIHQRQDYKTVVEELKSILAAGTMLSVQVEEFSLVETELRKANCRRKASEALVTRLSLEFMQQLMTEAAMLKLENENLFNGISDILSAAISWEERAKHLLQSSPQMSDFAEALRDSEDIYAILPSVPDIKNALSDAESWIRNAKPFLAYDVSGWHASDPLLKVDVLKDLLTRAKVLKVSTEAPQKLELILKNVKAWECGASSLLAHADSLLGMHIVESGADDTLFMSVDSKDRIDELIQSVNALVSLGTRMGFDFHELPKLTDVSMTLAWCSKALSLSFRLPIHEEVDSLIEESRSLPSRCADDVLVHMLLEGTTWVRKALALCLEANGLARFKLTDVHNVLAESQRIKVNFRELLSQLSSRIEKHRAWQECAHSFFNFEPGQRSWPSLLELKASGLVNAFDCLEMDQVTCEVEKVEKWMDCCRHVIGLSDSVQLLNALAKIRDSLKRSLSLYSQCNSSRMRALCIYCDDSFEDEDSIICSSCEERYHRSCVRIEHAISGLERQYVCPFCVSLESGVLYTTKQHLLIFRRKCPTPDMLIELFKDSHNFYTGIRERKLIEEIMEEALACQSRLSETVNQALHYHDKDLTSISASLLTAMKAVEVAGVRGLHDGNSLELALAQHSWKTRVKKLLAGEKKPLMQQIRRIMNEGLEINVSMEDHFVHTLREMEVISVQWANRAKKVACDSGALALGDVLKLTKDGENLPVNCEKELSLLKSNSMLYCICRKPYDQRPMIACDQCDEWYHFDCINLQEPPPNKFLCRACEPLGADFVCSTSTSHDEERTMVHADSERHSFEVTPLRVQLKGRRRPRKARSSLQLRVGFRTDSSRVGALTSCTEMDQQWRKSRRLRRTARRRIKFETLSLFVHTQ